MWVLSSETRQDYVKLSQVPCWLEEDEGITFFFFFFTSGDTVLLLPQLEELLVQLVVLPDSSGILCPVRLQESIEVPTLLLSLPC